VIDIHELRRVVKDLLAMNVSEPYLLQRERQKLSDSINFFEQYQTDWGERACCSQYS
jgi:hypothetical protein